MFEAWTRAIPFERTTFGWTESVVLRPLTEADAHRAAVFMRSNEDVPLADLFDLTQAELLTA
jgi:hypothetical protein